MFASRNEVGTPSSHLAGDPDGVVDAAPRIDDRLLAALARLDKRGRAIAETHRRLGRVADALELARPSYEQVRVHVHTLRCRELNPGAGDILLAVAFRSRSPEALYELLE